jgi:hypothetical protein
VRTARFSPDGRWIVTASQDTTARVWSAATGEALSPPIRHGTALAGARFLPEGRRILTSTPQGHCWLWELPVHPTPADGLQRLDQPVSGGGEPSSRQLTRETPESLPLHWRQLRQKWPLSLTASTQETEDSHERQAKESEAER